MIADRQGLKRPEKMHLLSVIQSTANSCRCPRAAFHFFGSPSPPDPMKTAMFMPKQVGLHSSVCRLTTYNTKTAFGRGPACFCRYESCQNGRGSRFFVLNHVSLGSRSASLSRQLEEREEKPGGQGKKGTGLASQSRLFTGESSRLTPWQGAI
jgi:hypothetical protein